MTRIFKTMGALAAATLLNAIGAGAVEAQQQRNCGPRDIVVTLLADVYVETRLSMGLVGYYAVIVVFACV
ncbi:MAG: hypothetical protein AAGL96_19760 [Pseudomonadota bacterium]